MQLYFTISGCILVCVTVNVHDCVVVYTFISTVYVNVCLCHFDNVWIEKQLVNFLTFYK